MTTAVRLFSLLVSCTLACLSARAATLYVWQDSPIPGPPFTEWASAAHTIQDAVDAAQAGDTVLVVGGVYDTGGRAVVGTMTNRVAIDRAIRVESLMGPEVTIIQGYQAPGTTNGDGAIRCVYLTDGAVLSGFTLTNGATRAAGDYNLEQSGGGLWCESTKAMASRCLLIDNTSSYLAGGAYQGTLSNCTLIGNASGYGGGTLEATLNNCVLAGNSALQQGGGAYRGTMSGCTLTGNRAGAGGGAFYGTLKNCNLASNSASGLGGGAYNSTLSGCVLAGGSAYGGGGAYGGTLDNCSVLGNYGYYGGGIYASLVQDCILSGNSASAGGGAARGTLHNCNLTGNSATGFGGGVYDCFAVNCLLYYNQVAGSEDNYNPEGRDLYFCCTRPMPLFSFGNITNEPGFVNLGAGDFHLRANSPCINAGNNTYATNSTDLDGNPRIVSGTVDIGAYEYQGAGSTISYAWLQQYGLPTDGSADLIDPDLDGADNWHEWMADTSPTNATSCLRLTLLSNSPPVAVTFPSSAARLYTLLSCSNLTPSSVWTPVPGQTDISGTGDALTLTDTNPLAPAFYRVSVRFP